MAAAGFSSVGSLWVGCWLGWLAWLGLYIYIYTYTYINDLFSTARGSEPASFPSHFQTFCWALKVAVVSATIALELRGRAQARRLFIAHVIQSFKTYHLDVRASRVVFLTGPLFVLFQPFLTGSAEHISGAGQCVRAPSILRTQNM